MRTQRTGRPRRGRAHSALARLRASAAWLAHGALALGPTALGPCVSGVLASTFCARVASANETAREDFVRVAAEVTSLSGAGVYIDRGRDAHVEAGDRVLLYPPGVSSVEGVVRAVAKNSARVELLPGSPSVTIGARVEIFVPAERAAAPAPQPGNAGAGTPLPPAANPAVTPLGDANRAPVPKPPPVHAPWTHPPENWSREQPLLAPAFGPRADERPRDVHGRAWIDLHDTTDSVGGTKRYFFGRLGTDLRVDNPFGDGGELAFDAEILQRSNSFPDAPSDSQSDFVLQRFSYAHGGTADEPVRWEAGRFLAREFPELGLVDGVEWMRRTSGGSRYGFNAGGLPEPFPEWTGEHDLGVALFGRLVSDPSERWTLGGAFQNSWHDGKQDRSLFVVEGEWRPSRELAWRSTAWIDFYDSGDTLKSGGFELTEITSSVRWRFLPAWGVHVNASHRRYPELLRDEFTSLSPALVQDGVLDRAALSLWHDVSKRTRIDARVDGWQDADDSGTSAELGVRWTDVVYDQGSVGLSVFHSDGTFSTGSGARFNATRTWNRVFGSLAYEYTNFDQKDFNGDQSNLAHQAIFGSLDIPLGERWTLSLQADDRFGDEQSAWSAGLMLQLRF